MTQGPTKVVFAGTKARLKQRCGNCGTGLKRYEVKDTVTVKCNVCGKAPDLQGVVLAAIQPRRLEIRKRARRGAWYR